ncbi:uncharacterized protein LOC135826055 isoform X1 [Sycon ciliatum]|uniref:uncharacterized protein LOC135826055 isoform X1 n=1 Tax=Sycon ciliatum TaxID=27933 RepID=UPI0031F686FB
MQRSSLLFMKLCVGLLILASLLSSASAEAEEVNCTTKPCQNGGTCDNINHCSCIFGYRGRQCQYEPTTTPTDNKNNSDTLSSTLIAIVVAATVGPSLCLIAAIVCCCSACYRSRAKKQANVVFHAVSNNTGPSTEQHTSTCNTPWPGPSGQLPPGHIVPGHTTPDPQVHHTCTCACGNALVSQQPSICSPGQNSVGNTPGHAVRHNPFPMPETSPTAHAPQLNNTGGQPASAVQTGMYTNLPDTRVAIMPHAMPQRQASVISSAEYYYVSNIAEHRRLQSCHGGQHAATGTLPLSAVATGHQFPQRSPHAQSIPAAVAIALPVTPGLVLTQNDTASLSRSHSPIPQPPHPPGTSPPPLPADPANEIVAVETRAPAVARHYEVDDDVTTTTLNDVGLYEVEDEGTDDHVFEVDNGTISVGQAGVTSMTSFGVPCRGGTSDYQELQQHDLNSYVCLQ